MKACVKRMTHMQIRLLRRTHRIATMFAAED